MNLQLFNLIQISLARNFFSRVILIDIDNNKYKIINQSDYLDLFFSIIVINRIKFHFIAHVLPIKVILLINSRDLIISTKFFAQLNLTRLKKEEGKKNSLLFKF